MPVDEAEPSPERPRARAPPSRSSLRHPLSAEPVDRSGSAETLAGFMAAAAIFVGAIALAVRPLPLSVAAIVLSLVATAMSGPRSARLAAFSVGAATLAFVVGMTIAVLTDHALY